VTADPVGANHPAAGEAVAAAAGEGALKPGVAGIPGRCAPMAERRGDQRYGTAAPVRRWLLVELPGPWGWDALRESTVDSTVAGALAARAAAAGVRVLAVRRPGRTGLAPTRRLAWVDSRPGRERVWWAGFAEDRELLDVAPDRPAGVPSRDPVYLVCAHGRHDACCAIRGRAVAAALATLRPDAVWECSHVGGDRFAANLVVLPHGLYYGHVTEQGAAGLVERYEAGLLEPGLLRGRSSLPAPVQAAQHHARLALGDDRVDALPAEQVEQLDGQTWRVRLRHAAGPVAVTVRAERTTTPVRLTCSSAVPETTRVFRLVHLELPQATGTG
jgi:hypothetical protein